MATWGLVKIYCFRLISQLVLLKEYSGKLEIRCILNCVSTFRQTKNHDYFSRKIPNPAKDEKSTPSVRCDEKCLGVLIVRMLRVRDHHGLNTWCVWVRHHRLLHIHMMPIGNEVKLFKSFNATIWVRFMVFVSKNKDIAYLSNNWSVVISTRIW